MHAAIEFIFQYPDISKEWHLISDYLALLSVDSEKDLLSLIEKAKNFDIKYSVFREPDIENQITAIALEPGNKTKSLCKKLPLALINMK